MHNRLSFLLFRLFILILLGAPSAGAALPGGVALTVEPILGYERAYKPSPSPHTTARLIYGIRAIAGIPLASGELEATRGADSEAYPAEARTIEETSDKVKLGLRSSWRHAIGSAYLRAGGQAQRVERIDTISSTATRTTDPLEIHPYAGTGLEIGTGGFRLSAGATVVFRDLNDWKQNDLETTLGFKVGI